MSHVSMAYHGTSGTQSYMAPEQWRGRAQGAAADQYSLAVMAYEMLSGHLPFDSLDKDVMKKAVLEEEPEPIEGVPSSVNQAIRKALSKEPKERFATCGEFADMLQSPSAGPSRQKPENDDAVMTLILIFYPEFFHRFDNVFEVFAFIGKGILDLWRHFRIHLPADDTVLFEFS